MKTFDGLFAELTEKARTRPEGSGTVAELDAGVRRSFAAIDTAHGGSFGYIGYSDWALRWLGDRNALPSPFEVDADGDNRITLAELQAQFARVFARLDKDGDGVVTRAEALTIRASVPDERGQRKHRGGIGVRPTGTSSPPLAGQPSHP